MSYSDVSAIDARMKTREDGYRDEAITVRDDQLKRLTAMRQADLSRTHMGQGDPGDAPAPQAIPFVDGQAQAPSAGAFSPDKRRERQVGDAGKAAHPTDKSIEISEASRRLLAKQNADPQTSKDRRALLTAPAAAYDVIQAPGAAALNAGSTLMTGLRNAGNRVVNAVAGREVLDTSMQAPQWSLTPATDKYIREPVQSMTRDAASLRALQDADKDRIAAAQGGPSEAAPTASAGATLNVRNNNPGNLKFAGQAGARPGPMLPDGTQFAVFDTPEAGVAANINQLRIYGTRGINTVEKIINTWSPATAHGNTPESTANYIAHVSKALGVAPNQPLDMANPQVLQAILRAQAPFEGGQGAGPSQTTQAQPTPGGIISNANAATPAQFTPAQFFSAREQVDQQTKMATLRLQQLREMAAVTRDPAELQKLHDLAMGLQAGLHEAQIYRVAAQAGAGNEGALSQLVQMMGGVGVARTAQGYVLVDPASGRATTAPLRPDELAMKIYGHLSASARAQAAASSKERDKAMYKAQGDMAVEGVKNQGAQKLEEMKANQAISEAILKNQLTSGDIMGVETNPVSGQTIVRTKRGVFAVAVEASKFDQKPTPKLVPITQ